MTDSIFVESNESKGILLDSYLPLLKYLIEYNNYCTAAVKVLVNTPEEDISYIRDNIKELKEMMKNIELIPIGISSKSIYDLKDRLNTANDKINKLLKNYSSLRNKIKAGTNLFDGILIKPKVYTNSNIDTYEIINRNIRLVFLALDWYEKALIDLYNLISQDLNLIKLVETVYSRNHIFESETFTENWIIPNRDYKINIYDWNPGNPLWITGADKDKQDKIAEKYAQSDDAEIITPDLLIQRITSSESQWNSTIKSISNSNPVLDYINDNDTLPFSLTDENMINDEIVDLYRWLLNVLSNNIKYNNNLYIITGRDICLLNSSLMATKPLIVVGSSELSLAIKKAKEDDKEASLLSIFGLMKNLKSEESNKDTFLRLLQDKPYEDDWVRQVFQITGENPSKICDWIVNNIKDDNNILYWDLRSPVETYNDRKGNSHDKSLLLLYLLNRLKIESGQIFFIEFNRNMNGYGNSHTLTWVRGSKGYYWLETSWEGYNGSHGPYDSINGIIDSIVNIYNNNNNLKNNGFDGILFAIYKNKPIRPYEEDNNFDYHIDIGSDMNTYIRSWKPTIEKLFN